MSDYTMLDHRELLSVCDSLDSDTREDILSIMKEISPFTANMLKQEIYSRCNNPAEALELADEILTGGYPDLKICEGLWFWEE